MPERANAGFTVARVYDDAQHRGYRVLVDRLWPRGVKRDDLALDEWAKDVAPTAELRRWYGHDPTRFEEFAETYRKELVRAPAAEVVDHLLDVAAERPVVLLTATRDVEISGACVLLDHLSGVAGDR